MAIASKVRDYIQVQHLEYEVIEHAHTESSMYTAASAHVPGDKLAKSVILEDEMGYVMAVLPSTHRLNLGRMSQQLQRKVGLATEDELRELFKDCEPGAIPPFGAAYGMETVLDHRLTEQPDIYCEAGDHERLIHVGSEQFKQLMAGSKQGRFSQHV